MLKKDTRDYDDRGRKSAGAEPILGPTGARKLEGRHFGLHRSNM